LRSPRTIVGAFGMAALIAGCPALVFDPPYHAVEEDASAPRQGDGTVDAPPTAGDEAGRGSDAPTEAAPITSHDGGPPEAAPADGPTPYDSGCAGVICNGVCMEGVANCAGCPGASSLCLATGTCVSSCGTCGDSGASCFMCADGGAADAAPVACGDGCLAGTYPHCACGSPAHCPSMVNQTCTNGKCTTCGEDSTDRMPCAGARCMPAARTLECFQSSRECSCM
jgi:hypothetical protein